MNISGRLAVFEKKKNLSSLRKVGNPEILSSTLGLWFPPKIFLNPLGTPRSTCDTYVASTCHICLKSKNVKNTFIESLDVWNSQKQNC